MYFKKKISIIFFIFTIFFISLFQANAICKNSPDNIKIYSGTTNFGNFQNGDSVYIKSNLKTYPLKIIYELNNSQNNCYNHSTDFMMKLFQNGGLVSPNSIKTIPIDNKLNFTSIIIFNFNINLVLTHNFVSTFQIKTGVNQFSTGNINFNLDTTPPSLQVTTDIIKNIYKKGDIINLNYIIEDTESGLKSLIITGNNYNSIKNFKQETHNSSTIKLNLSSSTNLHFFVKDKLGNQLQKDIHFEVDGSAPEIINNRNSLKFNKVYDFINQIHFIKFKDIILSDSSFSVQNSPILIGNFSNINPSASNLIANCVYVSPNYNCEFNPIEIINNKTSNVDFTLKSEDFLGNNKNNNFQTQVYIDNKAPKIIDFYFQNSLGIKNIGSKNDKNSSIYLKYSDNSIKLNEPNLEVIPNFGFLTSKNLVSNPECITNYASKSVICKWNISSKLGIFEDIKKKKNSFKVIIRDKYLNINSKSFNISIDNTYPIVSKIKLISNSNLKSGVIKSGDSISFKVFLSDDNLQKDRKYFVNGDFTQISSKIGNDIRSGSCGQYNVTSTICNFNNIIVRNGYRNLSVIFNISDIAGNQLQKSFNVEILKKANETLDAYTVIDNNKYNKDNSNFLLLLNPINRNKIIHSQVTAWFEGKLKLKTPTDKFELVNYALKGCSFKNNSKSPFLLGDIGLFPNSQIIYKKAGDEIFALKIKIQRQSNPTGLDLNNLFMNCKIAVLKKDNSTLYTPPELVNFKVKIGFYDLPRGNFLKANALKINELIGQANFIGSWFDSVYKVYNILKTLCSSVNGVTGILNGVTGVLDGIQVILEVWGSADAMDGPRSVVEGMKNFFAPLLSGESGVGEFISKACNFITCTNGGTIMNSVFSSNTGNSNNKDTSKNQISKLISSTSGAFCGKSTKTNSKSGSKTSSTSPAKIVTTGMPNTQSIS